MAGRTRSEIEVIKTYFDLRPPKLAAQEIKKLSKAERLQLAQEAARDSGLKQSEVSFPLS